VCNFNLRELKQAQACLKEFALASVQQEYNLLDRTIENNVLPYCDKNRITLVAYSPLIQGKIFAGDGKAEGIKKIADKYNKSPAQVALNWLVSHPSVIAIPKAADPVHIRENAASCDFALSKDDIDALNNIFKQEILHVPVGRIRVVEDARENRKIYKTLDEALGNKFGLTPSPSELADDIRNGEALKPVRVERTSDNTGRFDYDLVEGRIRYWAWVIAYNAEKPVPVYLRSA
jgi:predicted oxidoreductase